MGTPRWGYTGDYPPRTKVYVVYTGRWLTMTDATYSKLFHDWSGSVTGQKSPLWNYAGVGTKHYILRGLEDKVGDNSFHDAIVMYDHFYSNTNDASGYSEYEAMILDIFAVGSYVKLIHYDEGFTDLETLRHIYDPIRRSTQGEYTAAEDIYHSMSVIREKIPGGKEAWFHCDGYTNNGVRIGSPSLDAWTTINLKRATSDFDYGEYGKLRVESYYANKKLLIYLPIGLNVKFLAPTPIKDRTNNEVYNFWKWEWTNTSGQKSTFATTNEAAFSIPSNIAGITVAYKRTT